MKSMAKKEKDRGEKEKKNRKKKEKNMGTNDGKSKTGIISA
jgi:hypothetical protein